MSARDRALRNDRGTVSPPPHRRGVDRGVRVGVCDYGAKMTFRVKRPSRRSVRNVLEFMSGGTAMEQAPAPRVRKPRAQREAGATDALKEWRRYRPDVRLWRNNTGSFEWKPGKWMRFGLCTGSSDFIGLTTITISAAMVGRKVAVFTALEAKAEKGVVSDEQLQFIETVRDAGGIAGVARSVDEAEQTLNNWKMRMSADER